MEYLDIVDNNGKLTGQKETRKTAHQKALLHKVVHIWIMNKDGKILIQKRSPQKQTYPNMWAMSCEGHVSSGQSSVEGALRELKEELGLKATKEKLEPLFSYTNNTKHSDKHYSNHFIDVYLMIVDLDISKLKIQKKELTKLRWYDIENYINNANKPLSDFRDYPGELEKLPSIFKTKLNNLKIHNI